MPELEKTAADLWLPQVQAATRAKMSERQIQRYTADGRVRKRIEDGIVVVSMVDLARLKQAQAAGQKIAPVQALTRMTSALPGVMSPETPAEIEAEEDYIPEPKRPPRQWMTIAEASRWSGLSQRWLRAACEEGKLRAIDQSFKKGRHIWRVQRDGIREAMDLCDWTRTD